jgi:hypothetical protein
LFTTLGFSKLPPRFSEKLDEKTKFSYTEYNFPALIDVCEKLARQAVIQSGGKIVKRNGEEVFLIPVKSNTTTSKRGIFGRKIIVATKTQSKPYKPAWKPDAPQNVKFSDAEYKLIEKREYSLNEAVEKFFPGWKLTDCGPDMEPGYREQYHGKKNVVMTHPKAKGEPCILSKTIELPKDKKPTLKLVVAAHDPGKAQFDWELIVKADGKELLKRQIIGGWTDVSVDLSEYAGKTVKLELLNQPNGWACEAGYWSKIVIE